MNIMQIIVKTFLILLALSFLACIIMVLVFFRSPDFEVQLPNGYDLVRGTGLSIHRPVIRGQVTSIHRIRVYDHIIVGQSVRDKEIFFVLDTINAQVVTNLDEENWRKLLKEKYNIEKVELQSLREFVSSMEDFKNLWKEKGYSKNKLSSLSCFYKSQIVKERLKNYPNKFVYKIVIFDFMTTRLLFKDDSSTFLTPSEISTAWDNSDRLWIYNGEDEKIYFCEKVNEKWQKFKWGQKQQKEIKRDIQPPAKLFD